MHRTLPPMKKIIKNYAIDNIYTIYIYDTQKTYTILD